MKHNIPPELLANLVDQLYKVLGALQEIETRGQTVHHNLIMLWGDIEAVLEEYDDDGK